MVFGGEEENLCGEASPPGGSFSTSDICEAFAIATLGTFLQSKGGGGGGLDLYPSLGFVLGKGCVCRQRMHVYLNLFFFSLLFLMLAKNANRSYAFSSLGT